jgi:hypothetical protein
MIIMRAIERNEMVGYFRRDPIGKSIDGQIMKILQEMDETETKSERYPDLMADLERMTKVRAEQRRVQVSQDTIALIIGNLAGILLIIAYEQKHVMSSKGFTQILRPK